jgi:hypothetical protein
MMVYIYFFLMFKCMVQFKFFKHYFLQSFLKYSNNNCFIIGGTKGRLDPPLMIHHKQCWWYFLIWYIQQRLCGPPICSLISHYWLHIVIGLKWKKLHTFPFVFSRIKFYVNIINQISIFTRIALNNCACLDTYEIIDANHEPIPISIKINDVNNFIITLSLPCWVWNHWMKWFHKFERQCF